LRLSINHADTCRSSIEFSFAKEKFTVFYDVKDAGNQAPAVWKEKELVTEAKEKNAGYVLAAFGTLITAEVQECKCVTIEAESASEAAKAVATFYTRGLTNPEKNVPAVVQQGTGGGWTNNKVLAAKSSSLAEETAYP
jgi:hypothetical protein